MKASTRLTVVIAILTVSLVAGKVFAGEMPQNIILFIGDGMGMNHVEAASIQKAVNEQKSPVDSRLTFEEFPATGYLTTHSANMLATDSAAAGTALACGVKTQNGVIGRSTDGKDVDSIAVVAKKKGKAVGIVTSVGMDDATPAVFYAHAGSRSEQDKIMDQAFASTDFDVLMGGGIMCKAYNGEVLSNKCASANIFYLTASGLPAFTPAAAEGRRVLGYFDTNGDKRLSPAGSRAADDPEPRLTAITRKALEILVSRSAGKGFFMMVEGGAIDKYSHGNDTTNMVGEILELNQTVADTMEFLKEKGMLQNTLIVVTADHETGGVVLAENILLKKIAATKTVIKTPDGNPIVIPESSKIGKLKMSWSVDDHTCAWVPVFACGPEAQRFTGRHDNTDIAKIITALMQ